MKNSSRRAENNRPAFKITDEYYRINSLKVAHNKVLIQMKLTSLCAANIIAINLSTSCQKPLPLSLLCSNFLWYAICLFSLSHTLFRRRTLLMQFSPYNDQNVRHFQLTTLFSLALSSSSQDFQKRKVYRFGHKSLVFRILLQTVSNRSQTLSESITKSF